MKETISHIGLLDNSLSELQKENKEKCDINLAFNKKANLELCRILNSKVSVDKSKRDIKVWISDSRVSIRYIVDKEKQNSADIEINIAKKYDVMDYGNVVKPEAKKHNIKEKDVHQLRFSGFGIDVLKNGGSDIEELFEYSTLCHFIAKDFKETGEFFQKIKELYNELNSQWNYINDLHSRISSIASEKKKLLIDKYVKEFTDSKIVKEGNVIVIKNKKTKFHTLTSYLIESVKTKYFAATHYSVRVKSDWLSRDNDDDERINRYYLQYNSGVEKSTDIKNFISNLAEWKCSGEQIEVYTIEEWRLYLEMLKNETVNIMSGIDSEHYNNKSKLYEEIYYNR